VGEYNESRVISGDLFLSGLERNSERRATPTVWNVFVHSVAMCDAGVKYGPMDLRTNGFLNAQMSPSK